MRGAILEVEMAQLESGLEHMNSSATVRIINITCFCYKKKKKKKGKKENFRQLEKVRCGLILFLKAKSLLSFICLKDTGC